MNKFQKISILIVVLIAILGISWVAYHPTQPAVEEPIEMIKIGFIGPLTGDAAVYGQVSKEVVQLAVEEANISLKAQNKQIEMIYEDGKCNGKDASLATQKLISVDDVQLILGGFCSSESLAGVPIVEANRVLWFSPGSTSPDLGGISHYFARNYPDDASQMIALADIAYYKKGWRSVAFITEQLDYPQAVYNTFSARFESLGGTASNEQFESDETDFKSILAKIKSQQPDAIFINPQTVEPVNLIFKQLQEIDWKPSLLISETILADRETVSQNQTILEGALGAEFGVDNTNPKFMHLVGAYADRYGKEMKYQSYAQTYYDSVFMAQDAINEVGYSGSALADWYQNLRDWQGASGSITIKNGDRVADQTLKVIHNGIVSTYDVH